MNMPRQVLEAGQRADAELAALTSQGQGQPTPAEPGNTGVGQDPAPTQGQQSQAGIEPIPAGGDVGVDWKEEHGKLTHKFNVLQGKYNSEVAPLQRENAQLKATVTDLEARLEKLEQGTGGDLPPITEDIPPEIKEMYGDDLLAFIDSRAQLHARRESGAAVKPVQTQFQNFQQSQMQSRQEAFWGEIAKAHPDWEQINQLDAWINFCAQVIPEVGVERQFVIDQAVRRNDPQPIIAALKAFKALGTRGNQQQFQHREVPSDGGTGPRPVPEGAPRLKESEIAQFYQDLALGKVYRGREQEAKDFEAKIRAANEAGTIIMDVTGSRGPVFGAQ